MKVIFTGDPRKDDEAFLAAYNRDREEREHFRDNDPAKVTLLGHAFTVGEPTEITADSCAAAQLDHDAVCRRLKANSHFKVVGRGENTSGSGKARAAKA